MCFENIPQILKQKQNWVVWRLCDLRKIPYTPSTGAPAKANDANTWGSFEEAVSAYMNLNFTGIGFELGSSGNHSGITVIDLDHVLNNGIMDEMYQEIIDAMDSYTEISQSGTGVHIFTIAEKPGLMCRKGSIEIYDHDRFIAMTGDVYGGHYLLEERGSAISDLYEKTFGPEPVYQKVRRPVSNSPADDETVLKKARNAKNGTKFISLYDRGDISAYADNHSDADEALCCMLYYWTDGDRDQMDRLFRSSALFSEKWDEKRGDTTYGWLTIDKAFAYVTCRSGSCALIHTTESSETETPISLQNMEPRDDTAAAYMDRFDNFLYNIASRQRLLTGFSSFDKKLGNGLFPELITIGGPTGAGKTSFVLQITDHIASSGQDVLYFSLEMGQAELIAKSISRLTFQEDPQNALTARQVLLSGDSSNFSDKQRQNLQISRLRYANEIGRNVFIVEANEPVTIKWIRDRVDSHSQTFGVPAVMIVDYIQWVSSSDTYFGDKQTVDEIIRNLKMLSCKYNMPVIALSSLNRYSYNRDVTVSSFKESGSIEYASNILLGMNPDKNTQFNDFRPVTIDILKGRFINTVREDGKPVNQVFQFYSDYSCFKEDISFDD